MKAHSPSSKADSDSSKESFHSTASHYELPETNSTTIRPAEPSTSTCDGYAHEARATLGAVHATKNAALAAFLRISPKPCHEDTPIPCPCSEPLRYCQCPGTGFTRLCSDCAATDCNICSGVGVVPAFPVQPAVDVTEILERRGGPPGLKIAHDRTPNPPATVAVEDASNSQSEREIKRPSLRDIVLGRRWRRQTHPAPHSKTQHLRNYQRQPYYLRTPEDLTPVSDGPRPSDFELDLQGISVLQPQISSLPPDHTNYAPIHQQGWGGLNTVFEHEGNLGILPSRTSEVDHPQPLAEYCAVVARSGVGNWLAEMDEDGPIPNEYRPTNGPGSTKTACIDGGVS